MEPAPQATALDTIVAKMVTAARSRWPALDCPSDRILSHLQGLEVEGDDGTAAPPPEQDILYPDELYLAAACAARLEGYNRQRESSVLPAAFPLLALQVERKTGPAGERSARPVDMVVFRTYGNLRAVDAETGKLMWESAVVDPTVAVTIAGDRK